MELKKCQNADKQKIIDVVNKSFAPDRKEGFTIKTSVPQIYDNKNFDFSGIHFVIEDNNKQFVAVVGNLISDICINDKIYKFSRIGSVGTIPSYRGKGCMKQLMSAVNEENVEKKVVFSMLCGKRNRYKNFGYERASLSCYYTFDKDQKRYLNNIHNIFIREFNKGDLDFIYDIYKQNQKFVLRDKENFEVHLNNFKNKLYSIVENDTIVGYISVKGSTIKEINLSDNKYLESSISFALNSDIIDFDINQYNNQTIQVCASILNRNQCIEFNKIAEYKSLVEEYSFKVYDLKQFIEMLFLVNKDNKELQDFEEIYKIDDKIYKFAIKKKQLYILQIKNEEYLRSFKNNGEFISFVMGSELYNNSKIFPLYFDLNAIDNF